MCHLLLRPDQTLTTYSHNICCDHARSNGHNNLTTFQEQKKCCHNIVVRSGQTVSTSAHNKCDNVVTNVLTV